MQETAEFARASGSVPINQAVASLGEPRYSRRLGDRILAAFNHAYAIGATDIADRLREVLETLERRAPDSGPSSQGRKGAISPLEQAALWAAFVDARNTYNEMVAAGELAAEAALEEMQAAYRAWIAV
ncbi:MAG: hypothetical protein RIC93_03460 [Alphaproteobacteria bacterium]